MEYLKELITFLNGHKIKQSSSMLPGNTRRSSKIYQLYEGIRSGKLQTDEDISATFFSDSDYPGAYANRLKRKLRDRLINTVFLVDLNEPSYNEFQRAYATCYKNMAAIQILSGRYVHKPALELAEKTLRQSLHYGFADISLNIARYLARYYSTAKTDQKKAREYLDLAEEQAFVLQYEYKAEHAFLDLGLLLAHNVSATDQISQKAREYKEEFWPLIERIKTSRFNLYVFYLLITYYEKTADYTKMADISQTATTFYENNPQLTSTTARAYFSLSSIVALTALKKFDQAEQIGLKAMDSVAAGSSPWFRIAHYIMTSYYRKEDFLAASALLKRVKKHPHFKNLPGLSREYWRMHEAYIYFFSRTLSIEQDPKFTSNFRATTFVNQMPAASRDKKGLNTQILILQIMICLTQKKYDTIIQRTDALKTYTSRYLRKDENFRSNCFIKMLIQLPAANFHRAGVERKAARYYKKLTEESPTAIDDPDQEFIPYEIKWKYILKNLDYSFHYG